MRPALIVSLTLALLAACTPSPLSDSWLPPRPLGRDLSTFRPPRISEIEIPEKDLIAARPAKFVEPTGELRLADALSLALLHNPDLSAASYSVRMAEARQIQADLLPNPEVGVMVERVGGQDELRGVRGAETSLRFSQLIELGGKRSRRVELAQADQRLAAWDYEDARLTLFARTTRRFIDVLAAQERVTLAQENFQLAEQTLTIIADRVKQGVAAPVERDKATVRLSTERIVLARARRQLEAARHQLAATWGSATPTFSSVAGDLGTPPALSSLDSLNTTANDHPRLARWDDEHVQRRAALQLARAKGVPDLTAGTGVMHMNGMDEVVFMGQVMIPLPLFDRNQGGVLEAAYAVGRATLQEESDRTALLASLASAYHETSASLEESRILQTETLPAARASLDAAQDAYRNGKVTYLDVLDAQRTYVDVRRQLVDAQASAHTGVAMIEGLTGKPVK